MELDDNLANDVKMFYEANKDKFTSLDHCLNSIVKTGLMKLMYPIPQKKVVSPMVIKDVNKEEPKEKKQGFYGKHSI